MAHVLQNQQNQPPQQQNVSKMQHPAPTVHSATTNDKTILTQEIIALVAQAVQNIQPSNTSKHKHSAPSNTDHPEYEAQMEESFDSTTMTPNEW